MGYRDTQQGRHRPRAAGGVTAQRGVAYTCDDDPHEAATVARFAISVVLRICPPTDGWIALCFNLCAPQWLHTDSCAARSTYHCELDLIQALCKPETFDT